MAPEGQQPNNTPVGGLVMTGQYVSDKAQPGRPRPTGDGNYPDRYVITVLVGDRTVQVEYNDERSAKAVLPPDVQAMDWIALHVGVRAAKGFVFYYGLRR